MAEFVKGSLKRHTGSSSFQLCKRGMKKLKWLMLVFSEFKRFTKASQIPKWLWSKMTLNENLILGYSVENNEFNSAATEETYTTCIKKRQTAFLI